MTTEVQESKDGTILIPPAQRASGLYNHYIIDLSSNNNFVQNPTMQGDGNNVRGIEVELIANGVRYVVDRENTIVSIAGTKPDTKQILNECTITAEGYILVDVTSQMSAVKGRGDYCIVLMDKRTNSQLKSFPFYILTTSAPFNISEIISSDEFQLLTKRVTEIDSVVKEGEETIRDMRELEAEVSANEIVRINNENGRVSAEKTRQANETKRENEFDELMETANAEVERLQQENETASASAKDAYNYANLSKSYAIGTNNEIRAVICIIFRMPLPPLPLLKRALVTVIRKVQMYIGQRMDTGTVLQEQWSQVLMDRKVT